MENISIENRLDFSAFGPDLTKVVRRYFEDRQRYTKRAVAQADVVALREILIEASGRIGDETCPIREGAREYVSSETVKRLGWELDIYHDQEMVGVKKVAWQLLREVSPERA